jgi:hypothetical protein
MNRLPRFAVIAATVIGVSMPALSQAPPDLQTLGAGLRQNLEELQNFTCQSKITFLVDGVQRRVAVYKIRYDENGSLQRTQISGETAKGDVRGPDGKKLSKKQQEAALEFVTKAKNQLTAYLSPLFAEKAVASAAVTVDGDVFRLLSRDVVNPGDTVVVTFSTATQEPKTLHATATIEGSPMELDVTFQALDFGPFCPARSDTTTSWNGMKLQITTENSDYS